MSVKRGAIAAVITRVVIGSGAVAAQERPFETVGAWRVMAVNVGGRFDRCLAHVAGPDGVLRIHQSAAGRWNISTPCFDRFAGPRTMLSLVGTTPGETTAIGIRRFADAAGCRLATDPLDQAGGWVDELRAARVISFEFGARRPSWRVADTGRAMASVQECVRLNTAGAGKPPAAAKPAAGPQIDMRSEYHEGRWRWAPQWQGKTNAGNVSRYQPGDGDSGIYCYDARCWVVHPKIGPDGSFSFSTDGKNSFEFKSDDPTRIRGRFWTDFRPPARAPDATVVLTRKP